MAGTGGLNGTRDESLMPHSEVGFRDADGGPVMAGDAQVAGKGAQQFDFIGQHQRLDATLRLKVNAFALGA